MHTHFISFIQRHQRSVLLIVLTMLVCAAPFAVHAATGQPSSVEEGKDILRKILGSLVLIENFLFALLTPAIALIGSLLSNDWVMGTASGLDRTLESVWVFVRNIVNIGFVVVLLIMAFAHIIKSQSGDVGDYGIKSMLPNIVIAVVAVNFSLLGCRLLIDASSILTSAVFSIPNTVTALDLPFRNMESSAFTWTDSDNKLVGCLRPNYYFNIDRVNANLKPAETTSTPAASGTNSTPATTGSTPAASGSSTATGQGKVKQPKSNDIFVPMKKCTVQNETQLNADKTFYIKGTNNELYCEGQKFSDFYKADAPADQRRAALEANCILDMDSLLFSERNAMYAFAYGLLNIPSYEKVLSKNITVDNLTLSTLVSVVMLAVIILVIYALTLALLIRTVVLWGLIVSSPLWVLEMVFKGGGPLKDVADKVSLKNFIAVAFMPVVVGAVLSASFIVLMAIKMSFAELGLGKNQFSLGGVSLFFGDNPVMAGFGSIQDFIFALLVIAVLWTAVFAAIRVTDITGTAMKAVGEVENLGKSAAELAGKGLGAAPIIPIPGKGLFSANSLTQGAKTVSDGALRAIDERSNEEARKIFGGLPGFDLVSKEDRSILDRAVTETRPEVKNVIDTVTNVEADVNRDEVRTALRKMLDNAVANKTELGKYLSTDPAGKKFHELVKSDTKLSEKDFRAFIMNNRALNDQARTELLNSIDRKFRLGGQASPATAGGSQPITSFVKMEGNGAVKVGTRTLSADASKAWKDAKMTEKLANYQAKDGSLITDTFVTTVAANTDAGSAGRALRGKVQLPTGDALLRLGEALYPGQGQAFVDGYQGIAAGQGNAQNQNQQQEQPPQPPAAQ